MELTITPNFAQERALNMLRRDWKANDTFMVYSPTGSGKTGLAAFIVAGFVSRGMRVLFCAVHHPDRSDGKSFCGVWVAG
jgi:superfamily II DNA or RNA helicase